MNIIINNIMYTLYYDIWALIADHCPISFCMNMKLTNKHYYNIYSRIKELELLCLNTTAGVSNNGLGGSVQNIMNRIKSAEVIHYYCYSTDDNIPSFRNRPFNLGDFSEEINLHAPPRYIIYRSRKHDYGCGCCKAINIDKFDIYNNLMISFDTYIDNYTIDNINNNFAKPGYYIRLIAGIMVIQYDVSWEDGIECVVRVGTVRREINSKDLSHYDEYIRKYILAPIFDLNKIIPNISELLIKIYDFVTEL